MFFPQNELLLRVLTFQHPVPPVDFSPFLAAQSWQLKVRRFQRVLQISLWPSLLPFWNELLKIRPFSEVFFQREHHHVIKMICPGVGLKIKQGTAHAIGIYKNYKKWQLDRERGVRLKIMKIKALLQTNLFDLNWR